MGSRHSELVRSEQVRLLYYSAPLAYSVTLLNGAILAVIQSEYIALRVLVTWYSCLVVLTAVRVFVAWRYNRASPDPSQVDRWHYLYLVGAGAAGATWGSAAFFLFPAASTAHQAFVGFVLAGMAAGGITVLSSRFEACLVFLFPALIPLALGYFEQGDSLQNAMGTLTIIFLVGMCISGLTLYRSIRSSLELRFDNRELIAEIAQRRRVEENLFREKDQLQTVLSSIGEAVVILNAKGQIDYINPAAERLVGISEHDARQRPVPEVFQSFDRHHRRVETAMEEGLRLRRQVNKQSVLFCRAGKQHLVEEIATPLSDRVGNIIGAVSVIRDVTETLTETERLAHAATHDPLTGLPNRNLLTDRTNHAIARAQRKHENFALLFLDLDSFKIVNDNLGHTTGDKLLVDVAKRLTDCVRDEDTIARLGGDEFVVLLDGPTEERGVKRVADKILRAMRKPFRLGDQSAVVTASIGSSLYPYDGQDAETLLSRADEAMYRAKEEGRNRAHIS